MRPHSQSGFISIHLIAIVLLLLLISGAGQYLWRNALQLGTYCQQAVAEIGVYELNDACMAIGTSMASLRNRLEQMVGESPFGHLDLEQFSAMVTQKLASETLGFNSPQLSGLIDPGMLGRDTQFNSAGSLDKLKLALTHGATGSRYMNQGNSSLGLPYLQSSANMGEYGVLSQLSLGSAYAQGSGGVPRDLGSAERYNRMALDSIRKLQASEMPQAKQLLSALPASPEHMIRSLEHAIAEINVKQ